MIETNTILWQALALETIRRLAATTDAFSTDDVWATLDILPKPDDTRALGPVLTKAAKLQLIGKSGMFVSSKRAACHGRPVAVWVSRPRNAGAMAASIYVTQHQATLDIPAFEGSLFALPAETEAHV